MSLWPPDQPEQGHLGNDRGKRMALRVFDEAELSTSGSHIDLGESSDYVKSDA